MVRKRVAAQSHARGTTAAMQDPDDPRQELLARRPPASADEEVKAKMENLSRKSQWIVLAIASGACAACNGVFAKLTTTELTTSFATSIANFFGLANIEGVVEIVVRAVFFILNLLFNGVMWALFTKALARGTSTTQVSILNTSANFVITALLGFLIFSESLPPLWFVGAALLVAGNVIIGRREEGEGKQNLDEMDVEREERQGGEAGEEEELLGEELEFEDLEEGERAKNRRKQEEDVLQLDLQGDERRNDLQLM